MSGLTHATRGCHEDDDDDDDDDESISLRSRSCVLINCSFTELSTKTEIFYPQELLDVLSTRLKEKCLEYEQNEFKDATDIVKVRNLKFPFQSSSFNFKAPLFPLVIQLLCLFTFFQALINVMTMCSSKKLVGVYPVLLSTFFPFSFNLKYLLFPGLKLKKKIFP